MHCPSCKKWEITQFDSFCSWCQAKLVDFVASFNVDHLCVGDVAPDDFSLTLTHTGSVGTILVERIESSQPWLIPHTEQIADLRVQVGKDIVVPVEVDLFAPPDDYHEVRVLITSDVGGTREAVFEVTPRPKFQIVTGGEHTVLLDNKADEQMSGYLSVQRGIVTVESLAMETEDGEWATVEPSQSLPCRLDQRADNRLEFDFHVDEQYLLDELRRAGKASPVEYKGTLLVKFAEFAELRKETFRVKCFLPPVLEIPESAGPIRVEVFAGKRGEINLTLQNGERDELGHANLQIQEIRIETPEAPWLQVSGTITYPLSVSSGQYHSLTLVATTTELGVGIHPARVIFTTNSPGELREKRVNVDIDVRQMPDFVGVLAVDFGTTNSCCAYVDSEGVLSLIPIGDEGNQTTISSAILYQDLFEDEIKDYVIGNKAYEVSFQPSAVYSAVRQVKRLLGTPKPLEINFYQDPTKHTSYLPREVATDIIKRVLERAEEHVKGRISQCTISHPSRFSLGQLEDLKEAVVACGIAKSKIKTVHEPIGAALDFILLEEIRQKYPRYHLMVFDFGGGTTDITLMEVHNDYLAERKLTRVTTEVLGTTGDRWLGGEDVTDIVMELGHKRCEALLKERNPDAANVVVPFDARKFTHPPRKPLAQGNRNFLRFWAEAAKIAIAAYGDEHQEVLASPGKESIDGTNIKIRLPESFQLAVIVDNDVRLTETFYHDEIVPHQSEIDEQLKPRLENVAEMMKKLAEYNDVSSPDIILLSGKSSALPVVETVMREFFPEADIHRPGDLKQCVVRGACQLSNPDPLKGVELKIKGAKTAMTSRLGLRVRNPNTGLPEFSEVIDAGRPIGDSGLREPVLGIGLNRDIDIRILENTSRDEWISRDGELNKNITVLKVSKLDAKLAEWEEKHDKQVTDADLENATIELMVTPTLAVRLIVTVPGIDEPLEFEAEWGGG